MNNFDDILISGNSIFEEAANFKDSYDPKESLEEEAFTGSEVKRNGYQDHISFQEIEKIKVIGKGMFGKVYKCRYRGEIFALKTLTSSGRMTGKERERHLYSLKLEARALTQVRVCEYVVRLIGTCVDTANQVCIMMEYVPGPNLHQFMSHFHHRLSWSKKEVLAWEIATGVAFIHDHNILHRDLKSDNILISLLPAPQSISDTADELSALEPNMQHVHAKIADFGICKITTETCGTNESFRGAGSPPWMAPELCMDDTLLPTKHTDVYSLGWILWELAVSGGRRPYEGASMNQIFQLKMSGYIEPLPNDTPEYYQNLVTACTALEAKSRPYADQVVDTIRDAQEIQEDEAALGDNNIFGNIYETRMFRATNDHIETHEGDSVKPINYDSIASESSLREYTTSDHKEALLARLAERSRNEDFAARTDLLVLFGIRADSEAMLLCGLGDCYSSGVHGFTNITKAIIFYERSAELGYAPAICKLGLCYRDGIGKEQNISKAIKCFELAASKDDSIAQCCLGECYTLGIGVPQNNDDALRYFKLASEKDNADAQMQLGKCYYNGLGTQIDANKAHHFFLLAASQDHPEAQYILGVMYAQGISRPPNRPESYKWFQRAATLGHPEAQNNVGSCFYFGRGVNRDFSQAIEWFFKAASQGNASAQNNLGHCYEMGHGVISNLSEAFSWFERAAHNNHSGAQNSLGNFYLAGNGTIKSPELAFQWYSKAAESCHARAQKNLGLCYAEGLGVTQDLSKAYLWYTKAAEQGNIEACLRLGKMAAKGEGVAVDDSLAFYWFNRAAEANDASGQVAVGKCFLRGRGVPKNLPEGFLWISKAAAQNHVAAITYLGVCFLNGHGAAKNPTKAYQCFLRAANMGSAQAQFHLADLYRKGVGAPAGADMAQAFYYYEQAASRHHPMALFYLGVCFHRGLGVDIDIERAKVCLTVSASLGCNEADTYLDRIKSQLSKSSPEIEANDLMKSRSALSLPLGRSPSPLGSPLASPLASIIPPLGSKYRFKSGSNTKLEKSADKSNDKDKDCKIL